MFSHIHIPLALLLCATLVPISPVAERAEAFASATQSIETIDMAASRLDVAGMNRVEFIDCVFDEYWTGELNSPKRKATVEGASLWVTDTTGKVQCYLVPVGAEVVTSNSSIVLYRKAPMNGNDAPVPEHSALTVWNCLTIANLRGYQLVGACWGTPTNPTQGCTRVKCDANGQPPSCRINWQFTAGSGGVDGFDEISTCDSSKYVDNCGTTVCWNFGDGL